jgi:5,5'-dehydrodivanillate O-demethylase
MSVTRPKTTAEAEQTADADARNYRDFEHTGPGTLAGRYLRTFWHPVYHVQDLEPGQAVPIRVMSEDFTLYRGKTGKVHLLEFRCAHRGMQLSAGQVEGDCVRCLYHGWLYDGDGQCVEQPAEPEPFCQKIKIRSYPVRDYLGLVFAYLGDGEAPEFPRYPLFEDPSGVLHHDSYVRPCNYFLNLENALDFIHVGFAHRGARGAFDWRTDCPTLSAEETDWGIMYRMVRPSGKSAMAQFGMPNIVYVRALPNDPEVDYREFLAWWVPVDDERHTQFTVVIVKKSADVVRRYMERRSALMVQRDLDREDIVKAILAGKLRLQDVDENRVDTVRLSDDLIQSGQGPIEGRRSHERLGRSDVGIILGRKLWARELRALAENRPVRRWQFDAERLVMDSVY